MRTMFSTMRALPALTVVMRNDGNANYFTIYQTTAMSEVLRRHNLDEIELKLLNSHKIIS